MNKKIIRLTESDLHRIVKESASRILKEAGENPWGEHLNSPYNLDGAQYEKQGINGRNLEQIRNYVNACRKIVESLKNYAPIQNDRNIWQGFIHLSSYLSSLSTYVNYNMH